MQSIAENRPPVKEINKPMNLAPLRPLGEVLDRKLPGDQRTFNPREWRIDAQAPMIVPQEQTQEAPDPEDEWEKFERIQEIRVAYDKVLSKRFGLNRHPFGRNFLDDED